MAGLLLLLFASDAVSMSSVLREPRRESGRTCGDAMGDASIDMDSSALMSLQLLCDCVELGLCDEWYPGLA
eukprot:1296256-Prymnesium_polylepis.2